MRRLPAFALILILLCLFTPSRSHAQAWVARYNGPANSYDAASVVKLDAAGNVYVAGSSTGVGSGYDLVVVKYDPSGNLLWSARYNGPANGDDSASAMALDASGNVYVMVDY